MQKSPGYKKPSLGGEHGGGRWGTALRFRSGGLATVRSSAVQFPASSDSSKVQNAVVVRITLPTTTTEHRARSRRWRAGFSLCPRSVRAGAETGEPRGQSGWRPVSPVDWLARCGGAFREPSRRRVVSDGHLLSVVDGPNAEPGGDMPLAAIRRRSEPLPPGPAQGQRERLAPASERRGDGVIPLVESVAMVHRPNRCRISRMPTPS